MPRCLPLLALALLAGCGRPSAPRVEQPWIRLAAVPGRPAAAYFRLKGGAHDDALVRIESALASRIELHESMKGKGGMTTMAPLAQVSLPAGETLAFAPGGRHAMIFGLDPAVTPGTALPLRLTFASGAAVEAEAKSVAAGENAPY